jgi:hypothetical protein
MLIRFVLEDLLGSSIAGKCTASGVRGITIAGSLSVSGQAIFAAQCTGLMKQHWRIGKHLGREDWVSSMTMLSG